MSKDFLGQVFQLRKYVGHCYREVKSISDPIWLPYRYGFTSGDLSFSSEFALKGRGLESILHKPIFCEGKKNRQKYYLTVLLLSMYIHHSRPIFS